MLRFVTRIISNIDTKTISKEKLKKYLIFSIGEIILIVISILLANQVNIKNEERITKKKEIEYLNSLSNELHNNILEIEDKIILVDNIRSTLKDILKYTNSSDTLSKKDFNDMLHKVVKQTPVLNHESGVIENVIHSGDLNILSETKLKTYLASWDSWLKRVHRQEKIVSDYRHNIKELLINHGSAVTLIEEADISKNVNLSFDKQYQYLDNRFLLDNAKFENLITFEYLSSGSLKKRYEELKNKINNILKIIDTKK